MNALYVDLAFGGKKEVKKMWRKTKEKWAKILRMSKRCFTFAPAIEKMAG